MNGAALACERRSGHAQLSSVTTAKRCMRMLGDFFYRWRRIVRRGGNRQRRRGEVRRAVVRSTCRRTTRTFHSLALQLVESVCTLGDDIRPTPSAEGEAAVAAQQVAAAVGCARTGAGQGLSYPRPARRAMFRSGGRQSRSYWKLLLDGDWTVPVVELVRGEPQRTAIVVADARPSRSAATMWRGCWPTATALSPSIHSTSESPRSTATRIPVRPAGRRRR
jgi:hypothetical protein